MADSQFSFIQNIFNVFPSLRFALDINLNVF
jgi:hypothetical protein